MFYELLATIYKDRILHTIKYPKFITHIAKTDNKTKPNKLVKINGQLIYNSNINKFSRNIVVRNMKKYLKNNFDWKEIKINKEDYPIGIGIIFKLPINYGSVRINKNKEILWSPPNKDYKPNWDLDNLESIWKKVFNDLIQEISKKEVTIKAKTKNQEELIRLNIIPDDTVQFIQQIGPTQFIECANFEDRELIFIIYKL